MSTASSHGCSRVGRMPDPAVAESGGLASPCRKACRLLAARGICGGCGRTLDEIAAWPTADQSLRSTILAQAAARLALITAADQPPSAPLAPQL